MCFPNCYSNMFYLSLATKANLPRDVPIDTVEASYYCRHDVWLRALKLDDLRTLFRGATSSKPLILLQWLSLHLLVMSLKLAVFLGNVCTGSCSWLASPSVLALDRNLKLAVFFGNPRRNGSFAHSWLLSSGGLLLLANLKLEYFLGNSRTTSFSRHSSPRGLHVLKNLKLEDFGCNFRTGSRSFLSPSRILPLRAIHLKPSDFVCKILTGSFSRASSRRRAGLPLPKRKLDHWYWLAALSLMALANVRSDFQTPIASPGRKVSGTGASFSTAMLLEWSENTARFALSLNSPAVLSLFKSAVPIRMLMNSSRKLSPKLQMLVLRS